MESKLIRLLKKQSYTIKELSALLECHQKDIRVALKDMKLKGMLVYNNNGHWSFLSNPPTKNTKDVYTSRNNNTYLFGFIGDTHLCSKYERLDVLNDLYDIFELEGVDRVFHAGNWVDGEARFNMYDLKVVGMDPQIDYLIENYPQRDGIITYAVAGDDHEGWWCQRNGIDIGKHAENKMRNAGRHDWVNLGYMESYVTLANINSGKTAQILTMHPGGGSAYAVSYKPQKIVESFTGGEKPNVLLIGHYHKMSYNIIRNVHAIQVGCFTGNTLVETIHGEKPIRDINVGDLVLTHRNRYMEVTDTMCRYHTDGFYKLNYGRLNRGDQTITATPEHPLLVNRDGIVDWLPIEEVVTGDYIYVQYNKCEVCDTFIPYWNKLCTWCNPMGKKETRDKISETRGGFKRQRAGNNVHLDKNILSYCKMLEDQGWRVVPTGGNVIPDIIGFKDGKLVAFEVENRQGNYLQFKKEKYYNDPITSYLDDVQWINLEPIRLKQPRIDYEYDPQIGFIKVPVISNTYQSQKTRQRTKEKVYNFSVADDESYVAGGVVVHNCQQDQTPFMRKKGIDAHVGGGICRLRQDPKTGSIFSCQIEFFRYTTTSATNNRWNMGGKVNLPERKLI